MEVDTIQYIALNISYYVVLQMDYHSLDYTQRVIKDA